jgi:hypothetical protein
VIDRERYLILAGSIGLVAGFLIGCLVIWGAS